MTNSIQVMTCATKMMISKTAKILNLWPEEICIRNKDFFTLLMSLMAIPTTHG